MKLIRTLSAALLAGILASSPACGAAAAADAKKPLSTADVLAASSAADWRGLDLQNTLYLELPGGRVVIELTPQFAPNHVANILTLVRGKYFDGLAVMRSQDNYV